MRASDRMPICEMHSPQCRSVKSRRRLDVCYFQKYSNWGDALNPYLLARLTGRDIATCTDSDRDERLHLLAVGSILQWANSNSVVWGAGAISTDVALSCKPRRILAVRGPLSREICLRSGVDCPAILGDPALLMPEVYRPAGRIEHALGIIPHYVDQDTTFIARCRAEGLRVLDVFSEIESFVDQLVGCAGILSSSLHGLICADAYGVPSRWVRISDRVLGDGFKFRDYYASQGVEEEAIDVDAGMDLRRLHALPRVTTCAVDRAALRQALLEDVETWP
ncbi:MAG: polysaccharide pyruvyl transferase family protein [Thermoguttaceae bacterium]|jgi:pyruvyltransferase